jgi:hypothetical protein
MYSIRLLVHIQRVLNRQSSGLLTVRPVPIKLLVGSKGRSPVDKGPAEKVRFRRQAGELSAAQRRDRLAEPELHGSEWAGRWSATTSGPVPWVKG